MAAEAGLYRIFFSALILSAISNSALSQIDSIQLENTSLIKNCDSGVNRDIYKVEDHDYKKALQYDRKVIDFLNQFHDTLLNMKTIKQQLKLHRSVFHYGYNLDSMKIEYVQITTKGLIDLLITFRYINKKISERQFILTVNNKGYKYSENSDYLKMIVPLFKFKLHLDDCYTFSDTITAW